MRFIPLWFEDSIFQNCWNRFHLIFGNHKHYVGIFVSVPFYYSSYSISVVHSLNCSILNAQLDHLKCAFTQFCSTEAHLIPQSVYGIQNNIKTAFIIMYYYYVGYWLWVMGYGSNGVSSFCCFGHFL